MSSSPPKTASPIPAIPQTDNTLQGFRDQIDAIDADILSLLKQRSDVVQQVGAYKKASGVTGCFIRPAREAVMLRHLLHVDVGHYPRRELLAIWRLFIGGFTNIEQDITLSVVQNTEHPALYWCAREFFGPSSSIRPQPTCPKVVRDIAHDAARVGILPAPGKGDGDWWVELMHTDAETPRIYSCVPFVEDKAIPQGFLIAKLMPEPSGDDKSLIAIRLAAGQSRGSLSHLLAELFPSLEWLAEATQQKSQGHTALLFRVSGFHAADSQAMQQLHQRLEPTESQAFWLGAYASPILLP